MPSITPSLISVFRKDDLVRELEKMRSAHAILLSGPREECVKLCTSLEKAHNNSKKEPKRPVGVIHTESISTMLANEGEGGAGSDDQELYFIYVIVVVREGEDAMAVAESEIRAMDPRYLVRPNVDVVNWRSLTTTSRGQSTPMMEILKFSSRFNSLVHSVSGNNEESVEELGLKLYNRLQQVANHPHVPA